MDSLLPKFFLKSEETRFRSSSEFSFTLGCCYYSTLVISPSCRKVCIRRNYIYFRRLFEDASRTRWWTMTTNSNRKILLDTSSTICHWYPSLPRKKETNFLQLRPNLSEKYTIETVFQQRVVQWSILVLFACARSVVEILYSTVCSYTSEAFCTSASFMFLLFGIYHGGSCEIETGCTNKT